MYIVSIAFIVLVQVLYTTINHKVKFFCLIHFLLKLNCLTLNILLVTFMYECVSIIREREWGSRGFMHICMTNLLICLCLKLFLIHQKTLLKQRQCQSNFKTTLHMKKQSK